MLSKRQLQAEALLNDRAFPQARALLQEELNEDPAHPPSLRAMAFIASQTGQYSDLVEDLCHVLGRSPNSHLAYYLLGFAMCKIGQFAEGVECFDKAIALAPAQAEYVCDRASALAEIGRHADALAGYDHAIAINPIYAQAYRYKGNALLALGRVDAAIESFDQAIALQADSPDAFLNRGNALQQKGFFELALASYDQAIALQPHYPMAYSNRSAALKHMHRLQESLTSSDQAIAQDPGYIDAQWNKALTLLLAGDLAQGFRGYLVRWQTDVFQPVRRHFKPPLWLGVESIQGKRLFVHNEQGLGDSLQFCRFVTLAAQAGARVIYEVEPPLFDLMKTLEGVDVLLRQRDTLPPFDYYCPVMSLPVALGTTLDSLPAKVPYLHADVGKRTKWAQRLRPRQGLRVGLVWSGSATHKADHQRSISLVELMQALPLQLSYVCLQKELRDADQSALAHWPQIQHFGEEIEDFSDTAALCELMDIVIAVDTSVAHLAGALGVNTWVLLPHFPDWRWLLERRDSPWYPTMQLFRQHTAGHWAPVLRAVHDQLLKMPG